MSISQYDAVLVPDVPHYLAVRTMQQRGLQTALNYASLANTAANDCLSQFNALTDAQKAAADPTAPDKLGVLTQQTTTFAIGNYLYLVDISKQQGGDPLLRVPNYNTNPQILQGCNPPKQTLEYLSCAVYDCFAVGGGMQTWGRYIYYNSTPTQPYYINFSNVNTGRHFALFGITGVNYAQGYLNAARVRPPHADSNLVIALEKTVAAIVKSLRAEIDFYYPPMPPPPAHRP